MLETIIKLILRASLTAGIASAVVMLIRLPLKKAPKRWSYILWAVVFFRCLCPLSVESAVSIFNAVPERAETQQVSDDYEYVPPVDYDPIYVDYSGNADFNKTDIREEPVRKDPGSVYTILFIVWVSGASAMLLYAVISYVGLMVKMKTAIITADGIYETDRVSTAFSAGLFPPKIFLPEGLTEKERELIVAHERVHIRRLDFIFKPIAFAGLALHWFNPMVWISFALMTKDMELSCDEAVLKILGAAEKKSYSNALLKVSMKRSGLTALPIAFAGSGIKERVKNVLSYKKSGIIVTVIAAVVVLTAGIMLGTDAVTDTVGENPETRIWYNNNFLDDYAAVTNTGGEMFFIQYRGKEDIDPMLKSSPGLKNLVVYNVEDRGMAFENRGKGEKDIEIDIDPEKITKVVIKDLRADHYDDYDGDGVNDDLTYIAVNMELYMTDDNDKLPEVKYSKEYIYVAENTVQTVMCGGNEKCYGIYAEIEIAPSVYEFANEYDFSGYGIQLVGFGDAEIYIADDLKIADLNFPVVETHDDTDDTFKVDQTGGQIEEEKMRLEEEKRREEESAVQQLETAVAVREPEKMTYEMNKIIFPAHELDKTEYNARIFEIPKFTASFALPLDWTTGIPADEEERFCDNLWSPVNIYNENGELMGTIAFNTFEIYDDTTEENYYRMVYNQIMLGSVVSWDEGYTPLKTDSDSNGEVAAAKVRVRDDETREETYYPAVLAYDNDLLVYIGIQFDVDAVTEQQLFDIAASVTLS